MNQGLILVGDFQRTTFSERLLFREQNDLERLKLAQAIIHERPAQICFLGDMTAAGGIRGAWKPFDEAFAELTTPVQKRYAICGNHDYWGSRTQALQELQNRFSNLKSKTYGRFRQGALSILFLNSNFGALGAADCALQKAWFEDALKQDDLDETIKWIFVLIHHPPFSNSFGRRSKVVETNFVPLFLKTKKTRAMISGHVHAYEKFQKEEKVFLVCGGAGGPRVKIQRNAKSPFHYLKILDQGATLDLRVIGFQNVTDPVGVLDQLQF